MASWTSPVLHATGDILAVSDWNGVANNETFLYQAPYAMYYNSVATSLPNTTQEPVTLGGTVVSPGYGFSLSSNKIIVPLAGIYLVTFGLTVNFTGTVVGEALQGVVKFQGNNYITSVGQGVNGAFSGPTLTGTGIVLAAATNTLGLYASQSSGSTQNTSTGASATWLHAFFIGSQ